jgi:cytochrome c oxidase cbb3-type subunit 3
MKLRLLGILVAGAVLAQTPAPAPPRAPAPARGGGGGGAAYPQRTPEPAAVSRGKAVYDINCALCHGEDARGGDNGPNLIRGEVVMNDQNAELIGPVLREGNAAQGMPKFNFTPAQISDIAAFLHSFRVGGYDISRNRPPSIVVGDAKAGEAYFKSKCVSCHSATGDLKGIGARITDARTLQQRWLMPTGGGGRGGGQQGAPTTVTVTLRSGEKVEGRLGRIDDFTVGVIDADGGSRTIERDGDVPKVEIHDPLEPHKEMLKVYADKDIHDVTAYMVTLK